ncbi:MAG: tyrosine-type recombinase/integrase, partial [Planctomycetota bacterium]
MGKLKAEREKIARGVVLRKLGTTWWLDTHERGPDGKSQRTRINLGIADKQEALREARARAADILSRTWSPAVAATLTVESALVEWTEWLRQKRRSDRTIENSARLVGQFATWLKEKYGATLLKDITPKHLDDFLDWRARQPVRKDRITSPTPANNALSRVAAMLSWATKRRYLRENPAVGVERLPVDPTVKRVLRRDEIERIAKVSSPVMSDLILVLANIGCRLGEALALTANDVDLTGSQLLDRDGKPVPNVLVRSTKTRTLRRVPLNAVAMNILRRR